MAEAKVTVTIDRGLLEEIDRVSAKQKESRSGLVEEAIRLWRRREMEEELIEAYRAMAKENLETAEALLPLFRETFK